MPPLEPMLMAIHDPSIKMVTNKRILLSSAEAQRLDLNVGTL